MTTNVRPPSLPTEVIPTDKVEVGFKDLDAAILVGSMPRKEGMERKDLLKANVAIFKTQGAALDKYAKKTVKVTLQSDHIVFIDEVRVEMLYLVSELYIDIWSRSSITRIYLINLDQSEINVTCYLVNLLLPPGESCSRCFWCSVLRTPLLTAMATWTPKEASEANSLAS